MAKGRSGFDKGGKGTKGDSGKQSKPSYFRETEKAVQLQANFQRKDTGDEYSKLVYVPKSQLTEDGRPSQWIENQKGNDEHSYVMSWQDANGKKFSAGQTQKEKEYATKRQEKFAAGQKSYNELIQQAKNMGIKGVRVGMKRKTIEEKIRKHKS